MSTQYKNNHYVPEWYQKRFLPTGQINQELFYRNLKPDYYIEPNGKLHQKKAVYRQGFRKCFVEKDLYTTNFGTEESTKIEQYFFGDIDRNGNKAMDYFSNFNHKNINYEAFQNMISYMSTQKLRTPKGLGFLKSQTKLNNHNLILNLMMKLRSLYCAIWTECVWQIADASNSDTKFIISDHPITVYNRMCGPRSNMCRDYNDPEIWLQGTHTIFPLSLEKVLILTNLSWVRNPYQSPLKIRPNPNPFRGALFKFMDIQTMRHLTEQEVREINFIIFSRALQYIASSKEEWLYPEKFVSKSNWNTYGNGYLLMPDPRSMHPGGEIIIGYKDGSVSKHDEYGRNPFQSDFGKETKTRIEFETLSRFKGEFARLFGRSRRGLTFEMGTFDKEQDTEEFHKYHLNLENKYFALRKRKFRR